VFFVDDNLIGHKSMLRTDLLPALIDWQKSHPHMPFCTQVSINLADDPKMTEAMVEAGFDMVFIGIESSDAASLEECEKKQNCNRDMIADIAKLHRAGLEVQGGFIVGFDHDTADVFQQQIDFIADSGIVTAMVGQLQAAPGTRLKDRLAAEGRLQRGNLGHNTDGSTNFTPTMGLHVLRDGHARVVRTIFSPPVYYQRIRSLLREFPSPQVRRRLTRSDIIAMGRAMVRLGIIGAERAQYWKLLLWTLWHKPRLLAMAVRLAAVGHHHRRMAEKLSATLAITHRQEAEAARTPLGQPAPV
jgi:radical SAM superfamily enzyme YgiQ (UPF0313 family)